MKKQFLPFILALAAVLALVFASCSATPVNRKLSVSIPEHPWEKETEKNLWYTLKWTGVDGIESVHLASGERDFEILVPVGKTIIICAYPLGSMNPFGSVVVPTSDNEVELTQEDGVLASALIDIERKASERLNYPELKVWAKTVCSDLRSVDLTRFLRDLLNGKLGKTSVKNLDDMEIPQFEVHQGRWVSENSADGSFFVEDELTPTLFLPSGVHRYYNRRLNLELRIIVDSTREEIFHYIRQSLI